MSIFDSQAFFDTCRHGVMGPTLDQGEVDGATAILAAMAGAPIAYTAYALGTAWLETNHTLHPIKEIGGPNYFFRMYDMHGQRPQVAARLGNTQPGDGAKYPGMGYVQSTGRGNAAKATAKLGIDFINHPELLMDPSNAAKVMRLGMTEGWFTGKKFSDYLPASGPATLEQLIPPRRIINGTDRARDVANYAWGFQTGLQAGGWA